MPEITLRARGGMVVAAVVIDEEDVDLVSGRWYLDTKGYARRNIRVAGRRTTETLHRVLLGLRPGDGAHVDHRDGDPLNCRRSNLRVVTHAENMQNVVANSDGTSRFRGVGRRGRRWRARARHQGREIHLGWFDTELAAAAAARAWYLDNMPFADRTASEQIKEAK